MNFLEKNSQLFSKLGNDLEANNEIKRRKAQEIERAHICQYKNCGKAYGSYPALYTHIKLKHQNPIHKASQGKLLTKKYPYIKRINKAQPVHYTSSSSLHQNRKFDTANCRPIKCDTRTLNELYSDLQVNLQEILSLEENSQRQFLEFSPKNKNNSLTLEGSPLPRSLESLSDEFPSIQQLNQDILFPLKSELLSLTSPQTFVKTSASQVGISHKLAEVLAFLGPKIPHELYSEFCYFLGFFAKCILLRKIRNITAAGEDFQQIYEYIHDSIGYCTTFRFKYLKNGKIQESNNELTQLTKEIIRIIILITLKEEKKPEKEQQQQQPSHFIL